MAIKNEMEVIAGKKQEKFKEVAKSLGESNQKCLSDYDKVQIDKSIADSSKTTVEGICSQKEHKLP